MLSEEMLKQAAEELAHALNESLPKPEQGQHQFSERFDAKMRALLSPLSTSPDDAKTKIF